MNLWKMAVKGVKNPAMAAHFVRQNGTEQFWKAHSKITRQLFRRNDPKITERDWDNLLLLDACRYDLFQEYHNLPGESEVYYSVASRTVEFIKKTFVDESFPDIVLVTASPKYYEVGVMDNFHDVINVWDTDWNDELGTVPPDMMNNRVIETAKEYPNKRILAHYIQPHIPFIGSISNEIESDFKFGVIGDHDIPNALSRLRSGELAAETFWKGYVENHKIVLAAIEATVSQLPGKTVVTSDHGNALGKYGIYGHPSHRHIKELIEVPWHVYQTGDRKKIRSGGTGGNQDRQLEDVVDQRLQDLGYTE